MLAKIYSAAVYGVDAYEVEIEVNCAGGDPNMVIFGLFSHRYEMAISGAMILARPSSDIFLSSRP